MTQGEAFTILARLRKAGFFTILWTPEEVEGVSADDLNNIEERLITAGNDLIADYTTTLDEAPMCATCNGSGEGMYDGSSCRSCGGKGIEQSTTEKEYEEA